MSQREKVCTMDDNDETDVDPKRKDRKTRPPKNRQISNRMKLSQQSTTCSKTKIEEHQYPVYVNVNIGGEVPT